MVSESVDGIAVEELALDAQETIRDGLKNEDSVSFGDGISGSVTMSDAGLVMVYDLRDYEPSKVNRNMLTTQLGKTDTDVTSPWFGKRVFTTRNLAAEGKLPKRGTFKCFLHREAPDRAKYDALGFATCPAGSISSPANQESHAKSRHKAEWASIEADKARIREERRDKLDEANLNALLAQQNDRPRREENPTEVSDYAVFCGSCGWFSDAKTSNSRKASLYKHTKQEHPDL